MIQPSVYSREQIVQAAFELIRQEGWSTLSTRAIAREMGSSTMPIYSHLKSVDDLQKELRLKGRSLLKEYQQRTYTEHVLLNLALGYVAFARDEKMLFRFLFIEHPERIEMEIKAGMAEFFFAEFGAESPLGRELLALKASGQDNLVRYAWIFTHGLAMLVNSGSFERSSDEDIQRYLMNAGEAFYSWAVNKGDDHDERTKGQ